MVMRRLGSTTSMSTPQADVDALLGEVADEHGLELGDMLPEASNREVVATASEREAEGGEGDLARRLEALRAGGAR